MGMEKKKKGLIRTENKARRERTQSVSRKCRLGKNFRYGISKGEAIEDSCEAHLSHEISDGDENKCLMIVFYILISNNSILLSFINININFMLQPSSSSYYSMSSTVACSTFTPV